MAENIGFEPMEPVTARLISNQLHSTTLPIFRIWVSRGWIRTNGLPHPSERTIHRATRDTKPLLHQQLKLV